MPFSFTIKDFIEQKVICPPTYWTFLHGVIKHDIDFRKHDILKVNCVFGSSISYLYFANAGNFW